MPAITLKWSSLLRLSELDFKPQAPTVLSVSEELLQSISWLTAATRSDRKLLRCDINGALLVSGAWNGLNSVLVVELYPQSGIQVSTGTLVANKGVLVATSTQIVRVMYYRISGGNLESIYVAPATEIWIAGTIHSLIAGVVPDPGGTASYVGISVFN